MPITDSRDGVEPEHGVAGRIEAIREVEVAEGVHRHAERRVRRPSIDGIPPNRFEVTVEAGRVTWLQGNPNDASHGTSLCPKGAAGLPDTASPLERIAF